ncbi:MAG: DUF4249 domain-containing protein [Tannerellaceae bacterium]|nr:DUF4249 domain-containing protein [Tannerellaceae bacterium]
MWKKYLHIVTLCIFIFSLYGCIEYFEHAGVKTVSGLLVVEGTIDHEETIIKLSRSGYIGTTIAEYEYVENAEVYVESRDGFRSEAGIYTDKGEYIIQNGLLSSSTEYRLFISLEGEEYISTFHAPLFTPEIELSITKEKEGAPVYVYVSTQDPQNQSPYYRWEYKENWEVHADLYANVTVVMFGASIKEIIRHDIETPNNKYHYWGADSSKMFILDSTEKLTENVIRQKS